MFQFPIEVASGDGQETGLPGSKLGVEHGLTDKDRRT
jgi:hypothetical protein